MFDVEVVVVVVGVTAFGSAVTLDDAMWEENADLRPTTALVDGWEEAWKMATGAVVGKEVIWEVVCQVMVCYCISVMGRWFWRPALAVSWSHDVAWISR